MKKIILLVSAIMMTIPLHAGEPQPKWTFDTSKINPERNLHVYQICRRMADALFDPDANLLLLPPSMKKGEPIVADKTKKHMIRESAYYAYALLLTGDGADRDRAVKILRQVISKQDLRPDSKTKGIYAWYWEQDLEKTPNPDVNSAAFVGSTLADILLLDHERKVLPGDFRPQLEQSFRLSVEYTMRRNVNADYTNIALLSVAHAAGGMKLLGMKDAGEFAQKKINEVLRLSGEGLFPEYLSPTYTGTDVTGAYLAQKLSFSPEFTASVKTVIDKIWMEVACSFHVPTLQLAGPHSRAYGDDMRDYGAVLKYYIYFARPEGYPLPDMEVKHAHDFVGMLAGVDLPIERRTEFAVVVPSVQKLKAANQKIGDPDREFYQYREGNFILGTVALQDHWEQRRDLVAYWRNEGEGIGGFRLGMCIEKSNEKPPQKGWVKSRFYSMQEKNAALVVLANPAANLPKDGGSRLFFSPTAKPEGSNPMVIQDGAITTYFYPISPAGKAIHSVLKKEESIVLERSWAAGDTFGDLKVLSYLAVFRPSSEKAPQVTEISIKSVDKKIEATATVDGIPLTVSFSN